MLEKLPEKRITASEALKHPFMTMDRAIFKFKKAQTETRQIKLMPMKMYRNFEDLEEEPQSPTKPSVPQLETSFSNFFEETENYFTPFAYDHANINLNFIGKAGEDEKKGG